MCEFFFPQIFYLNCIRILLQQGANPNCSYRLNLTPLHVLIFTISENFTLNCDTQKRTNFEFIKNILLLLLQCGLNCNLSILRSVNDMVQNVRTYPDISCIYELLLALLQYGADPNIQLKPTSVHSAAVIGEINNFGMGNAASRDLRQISQPGAESSGSGNSNGSGARSNGHSYSREDSLRNSFRNNNNAKNYILFYYIMLITRKELILTDPERTYSKIIYLLYYSMKHDILYNCLKSLHNLFIAQVPNKLTDNLITLISTLYRRPRSLKELSRLRIYECLNRKIAQNVNRLNLPGPLKDYVLNFE